MYEPETLTARSYCLMDSNCRINWGGGDFLKHIKLGHIVTPKLRDIYDNNNQIWDTRYK